MQTLSMFAPMAVSGSIPKPTNSWEAGRFSNFLSDSSDDEDDSEDEESMEDEYVSPSIYSAVPNYSATNFGFNFDPRLRGLTTTPFGDVSATPVPVLNTVVNPVENLSNRIPMPTLSSPVETADISGASRGGDGGGGGGSASATPGMDPMSEDATCCGPWIPHYELRQTRELLGMNEAGRARYGRSAGEGVSLQPGDERVSGTQQHHGPVATSDPLYTEELYDQGFVSMSAVPSVHVGEFTDPITGQTYQAWESALPPPDADYEETLNSSGRNVKLAHLQGGWRDTTPRPTKTEQLEDDFHMQYDRSINTYGTYDPSYYIEAIEHNNRFSRDDHHPDAEGPIITGIPANTMGNQGDVKIRAMPYVPPTNRGKWAETTFRTGIVPETAAGGGYQRPEYEWTNTPYTRAESSRMDGGGMQPTANYEGFMQQYGGSEGWDNIPTQRSTTQHNTPNMGPAQDGGFGQGVFGDVEAPTSSTGTRDSGMYAVGHAQSQLEGQTLQNQVVAAPNSQAGLDAVDAQGLGPAQYSVPAQKLMNSRVDLQTSKSGLMANTNITMGADAGANSYAQQLNKSVHSAQHKTKREAMIQVQAAFDTALGNYNATQVQPTATRFSDKSGHLVDFVMPGGTLGGTESMTTNGTQNHGAVTKLSTKREAGYDNQFGVKSTQPDDSTVWYGDYRQNMEHANIRPEGNLVHANSGNAGMAIGLRDDREALSR